MISNSRHLQVRHVDVARRKFGNRTYYTEETVA
jgi:hypothetical protein